MKGVLTLTPRCVRLVGRSGFATSRAGTWPSSFSSNGAGKRILWQDSRWRIPKTWAPSRPTGRSPSRTRKSEPDHPLPRARSVVCRSFRTAGKAIGGVLARGGILGQRHRDRGAQPVPGPACRTATVCPRRLRQSRFNSRAGKGRFRPRGKGDELRERSEDTNRRADFSS